MRTVLFLIIVIGIVSMGFYFSRTPDKPKPSQIPTGQATDSIIERREQWPGILYGQWQFKDIERNERWYLSLTGDIEFFRDGTFSLGVAVKNYDLTEFIITQEERKPNFIGGGSLKGKWKVIDDYIELSQVSACNFKEEYREEKLARNFDPCTYYEGKKFGMLAETENTTVKRFTNTDILIEGKRYSSAAKITYNFYRELPEDTADLLSMGEPR